MAIPKLYQANTQTGVEGQRVFELHSLPQWDTIACSDGQVVPDVDLRANRVAVREAVIISADAGMDKRFDLLEVESEILPRMHGNTPLIYKSYRVHYALDPELEQLFDFLQYNQTYLHKNEIAKMQANIDHWQEYTQKNLNLFVNAEKERCSLALEVARLKRPWYLKVWHSIIGA